MKRVLIVEDQPDIRQLIVMTLEMGSFAIDEAPHGEAGWQKVLSFKPDLVLLDVMMPGALDGFQVCERIRADAACKRVKVVMLTARSQDTDVARAKAVGANDFLRKPFSPRQLLDVVNRMV